MTGRASAIADTVCILVLPTNFIVLVSSCFRVAHIQQRKTKSNSSGMRAQSCLSTFFVLDIVVPSKWPEKFDPAFLSSGMRPLAAKWRARGAEVLVLQKRNQDGSVAGASRWKGGIMIERWLHTLVANKNFKPGTEHAAGDPIRWSRSAPPSS